MRPVCVLRCHSFICPFIGVICQLGIFSDISNVAADALPYNRFHLFTISLHIPWPLLQLAASLGLTNWIGVFMASLSAVSFHSLCFRGKTLGGFWC